MTTLLTTSKMDPALAARIEASVRGTRGTGSRTPRVTAALRVLVLLGVALAVVVAFRMRRREREDTARQRREIVAIVAAHGGGLGEAQRLLPRRVESMLVRESRAYEADVAMPGWEARLLAPLLYVRGPVAAFATPKAIAEASAASFKDALLLCLLDPPASRAEKDLLDRVRIAYGRGAPMEQRTAHVRRLHEAEVGLPFFAPAWSAKVAVADDDQLGPLRRELDRAPLDAAVRAARSEGVLAVMDEPAEGTGPTELDGERVHWVRVVLLDVATETRLFSARRKVDPSWISLAKKSDYATGLDSCGLAFDLRSAALRR